MRKLHTPCRSGQKRRGIDPHRVQLWPRGRGMIRKQPRRRKFPRAALVLLLLIVGIRLLHGLYSKLLILLFLFLLLM